MDIVRGKDGPLAAGYAAAGFEVASARRVGLDQLRQWPSTWAGRLRQGRDRAVLQIVARARNVSDRAGADSQTRS